MLTCLSASLGQGFNLVGLVWGDLDLHLDTGCQDDGEVLSKGRILHLWEVHVVH